MIESTTRDRLEKLRERLRGLPRAIVAYSGGVDSAFLLHVAAEVMGDRVTAVTAISPSIPGEEVAAARALAERLGVRRVEVESRELEDPRYASNPSNRCFWCKSELFERTGEVAAKIAHETGDSVVVLDGTNLDDAADHRPGREAAARSGVVSPLLEAGLSKAEIRGLSQERGLPTWDKPSAPCLASRIPYGTEVTPERLARIGEAERAVRAQGFREFRVRFHDKIARIEIAQNEMARILDPDVRRAVVAGVKAAGFTFVAVDLDGLRSGSLNVLASEVPAIPPGSVR
jgi:pyridinium-3,5-biscarboxylic acid mononucleotide sulfurtransferase